MTSTITFLNHWGEIEDTFGDISTTPRSWVTNGYGKAEFSIPRTITKGGVEVPNPVFSERLLRVGNLVHITHKPSFRDEGEGVSGQLPSWTGIILTPVVWNTPALQVIAYSLESVFAYRAAPSVTMTGSPDEVFKNIIQSANDIKDNPFYWNLGQIDPSPLIYRDDLRTNCFDHIIKLAKQAGMEFSVTAEITDYIFRAYVHLKKKQTARSSLSLTTDNTELSDPILTEQGIPWNVIHAFTQANTEADRVMITVRDDVSIAKYGPLEINQVFLGTKTIADLTTAANAALAQSGQLQRVFKRVALDVGQTFSLLRPGALVLVDEPRAGFNANGGLGFKNYVRILSMDYNDTSNKVNLNVEIVQGEANLTLFSEKSIAGA